MATYSFLDINCSISGTGGNINLASGAGAAEEGISIEPIGDKNIMTIGADGSAMHSLVGSEASSVKVRLLKTSPTNAMLMAMYNAQTQSSLAHGKNVITLSILQTGEIVSLTQVAFKKRPALEYAKEAKMMEWEFDCGKTSTTLGVY